MPIAVIKPSNEDMQRCVVRHREMRGTADGFPDSDLPGCYRVLYNYMGFAPPAEPGATSPVGNTVQPSIKHLKAGFGVAFVKTTPGNGVPFHVHDANETFMSLSGTWRCEWEGAEGVGHAILGQYDLISFPAGVQRRFESVALDPGTTEGILLGVLGGDHPGAEYSPEATEMLVKAGKLPPEALEPFRKAA
ncbi:MAG: hypothetical protein JNM79_20580 [Burkholderiales bacterium]|nr:hypothetical protein [Burkholderiales bacterium]